MWAEPGASCHFDYLQHLIGESGHLDDAKQLAFELQCSQNHISVSRKSSKPIYINALAAQLAYNLHILRHTPLTSATSSHHSSP